MSSITQDVNVQRSTEGISSHHQRLRLISTNVKDSACFFEQCDNKRVFLGDVVNPIKLVKYFAAPLPR